jgi:uridine kinase
MKNTSHPKIIAITGGSGSGKTWLAASLQHACGSHAVRLSQDDFYKDLGHLPVPNRAKTNFDDPRAIDWESFEAVLRDCREGRATRVPHYDFTTHTRLPEAKPFLPAPLILVEGLWLLWRPEVRNLFDLKIFIDCPADLRLERRLSRDVAERGRTPESIREQFSMTVAPMHEQFVAPQAAWAHVILKQPFDKKHPRERINAGREKPTVALEEHCLSIT